MPVNNMSFQFAGAAGTGSDTQGRGWAQALMRSGLYVFGLFDFESRIRGGHIFYHVRVSDRPVHCHVRGTDLLVAFDELAVHERLDDVLPGGAVIYDSAWNVDAEAIRRKQAAPVAAPLKQLVDGTGGSDRRMINTAAVGVLLGLVGMPPKVIEDSLRAAFSGRYAGEKGSKLAEENVAVLRAGIAYARTRFQSAVAHRIVPPDSSVPQALVNGNQAICIGAIAGGCRFIAGYPMTPASTILEFMADKQTDYGIVIKQTEDELAAAFACVGAAHVGARAMTATSGGGFCLMAEALGLAGCSETGVVFVDSMRAGPSTGLPTRTEQGDLDFVVHAAHGEFPRFVLTPGSVEECFEAGWRAFNLAEKYQTPVIVLTDLFQSFALKSVPQAAFAFDAVTIDRGELMTPAALDARGPDELYLRFKDTPSGISPRALPGHARSVHMATGDEHSERGFITESAAVRTQQMQKRMRKVESMVREMRPPARHGPAQAELTLVGWGSTKGAIAEAVDRINAEGGSANAYHFVDVWPMPVEAVTASLGTARYLVGVEQNYSGQLASLIRQQTGINVNYRLTKFDGRQISPEDIVARVNDEVKVGV
ncbi:MAG: 2-oxoacid:acceptor oxidoreductase subunit alpha [Actinobacteria bacterium]|nr:2-oxoacid:acceptor oxidoreductase subunit alpha [Actinomycetota bacterium]